MFPVLKVHVLVLQPHFTKKMKTIWEMLPVPVPMMHLRASLKLSLSLDLFSAAHLGIHSRSLSYVFPLLLFYHLHFLSLESVLKSNSTYFLWLNFTPSSCHFLTVENQSSLEELSPFAISNSPPFPIKWFLFGTYHIYSALNFFLF